MCFNPICINNPNGPGKIHVPCGRCAKCLSRKRGEWSLRLEHELSTALNAYFITLTYDEENIPLSPSGLQTVSKRDLQLFNKRLRYFNGRSEKGIKYYSVSEYGGRTKRPHYHGIYFNVGLTHRDVNDLVFRAWRKGHIFVGSVTQASIAYVTKYVINRKLGGVGYDDRSFPFSLISNGIGKSYISAFRDYHEGHDRFFVTKPGGAKVPLPRYYRQEFYTDEERAEHASLCASSVFLSEQKAIKRHLDLGLKVDYYRYKYERQEAYTSRLFSNIKNLDTF